MTKEEERKFVNHLIEATRSGKIDWSPTAVKDQFAASVQGKYIIAVTKGWEEDEVYFELKMFDQKKRDMLETYQGVAELFQVARERGLRVDEAVTDILENL